MESSYPSREIQKRRAISDLGEAVCESPLPEGNRCRSGHAVGYDGMCALELMYSNTKSLLCSAKHLLTVWWKRLPAKRKGSPEGEVPQLWPLVGGVIGSPNFSFSLGSHRARVAAPGGARNGSSAEAGSENLGARCSESTATEPLPPKTGPQRAQETAVPTQRCTFIFSLAPSRTRHSGARYGMWARWCSMRSTTSRHDSVSRILPLA